jgi:hypothetical protein
MKTTKQNIKAIVLGLVVAVGVGYASAEWNPAPATGPADAANNNAPAPINVGISTQTKTGILNLLHLITPDLTVTNSNGTITNIPDGSVLVADGANTGKVKWATTTGAGGGGSGPTPVYGYDFTCTRYSWSDGKGHTYTEPYCFKLNKTTGVVEVLNYSSISFGQAYTWNNIGNLPITTFGTAPYTIFMSESIGYPQDTQTEDTFVCVISSSNTSRCLIGSLNSQDWKPVTKNPF